MSDHGPPGLGSENSNSRSRGASNPAPVEIPQYPVPAARRQTSALPSPLKSPSSIVLENCTSANRSLVKKLDHNVEPWKVPSPLPRIHQTPAAPRPQMSGLWSLLTSAMRMEL